MSLSTGKPNPLREAAGISVALVLLALYVVFVPLHTQDGPNHRQVATLLSELVGSGGEDAVYETQLGPLHTNQLFPVGFAFIASPAGIPVGSYERLFVGAFLLILVFGYRQFLKEWAPHHRELWVWCLPLTGHALFVTGMYNFLAATALTFPALIFLRRTVRTQSTSALVAFLALAWMAFLAHPFPFFVLPVVWVWLWVERGEKPGLRAWGAGGVMLAFLLLGFALPMLRGGGPDNPYLFKPPLELLAGLTYYNFALFSVGHLVAAVPAWAAAAALLWIGLKNGNWHTNALWVAMLVGYFLFPSEGHGGAHINERFLPFAWAFIPLALTAGAPLIGKQKQWIRAAAVGSTFLMGLGIWQGFSRVGVEVRSAEVVLADMPRGAKLYPLEFDPAGGSLTHSPLTHLWSNYPTGVRAYSPYQFTFMELMPVARRISTSETYFPSAAENLAERIADGRVCQPAAPVTTTDCGRVQSEAWAELMDAAAYYDYWFVHAAPLNIRTRLEETPGLTLVGEEGRASLWHFEYAKPFSPALR